jgi:hypothetical protein
MMVIAKRICVFISAAFAGLNGLEASALNQTIESTSSTLCTVAVFKVIEKRTNRIKVVSAVLGDSARYGMLILQPRTCEMHKYAGGHHNAIAYVDVWTLPYRAMQEVKFSYAFSPTLTFSGYMSTISPTFTHRNYEIIAMECKTEACPVGALPPR